MFMHYLTHELNQMGEQAFLSRVQWFGKFRLRSWLHYRRTRGPMLTNPALNTPIAGRRDITSESIVVYPEFIPGNPLKARNVVRWLLYKPGLRHPYEFGPKEMFFRAGKMSDLPEVTGGAPDLYLWKINPLYRNENRSDRKGVCYLVRKGDDKPRIPETETAEAIRVDGMSHEQMNEVFNRCDTFYSYDEATMYSQFAAISGCTSIVVPGLFSSRQEWMAEHAKARYGVAYGNSPDELDHARSTREQMIADIRAREAAGVDTVRNFVALTKQRFWNNKAGLTAPDPTGQAAY